MYRSNFPSYPPLVVVANTLSAVSDMFCRDPNNNSLGYICSVCNANSSVTIDNYYIISSGWNICNDDSGVFPYFGYALYKINNNRTSDYFYIDFRDCNYKPTYVYGYLATDISIYLNLNYDGQMNSRYEYNMSSYPHVPIVNGSILRIWNIEHLSPPQPYSPNTYCFPNFWQNCLILISSQTGNHPRLVWGPYPESVDVVCYKIWRKYGVSAWQLRTTVSSSTYEYIDESVYISPRLAGTIVQYKITAVYDTNSETLPTNTVAVNVKGAEMEKIGIKNELSVNEFVLTQNNPNPFNPSTVINYSIKKEGLVTIKVYNVLGKEVATLVNENKPEGIYEAEFDASSLPSGMYVYKMQAGSFTDVKKMLLLK